MYSTVYIVVGKRRDGWGGEENIRKKNTIVLCDTMACTVKWLHATVRGCEPLSRPCLPVCGVQTGQYLRMMREDIRNGRQGTETEKNRETAAFG